MTERRFPLLHPSPKQLTDVLHTALGHDAQLLHTEPLTGGKINTNLKLTTHTNDRYVLRIYARGPSAFHAEHTALQHAQKLPNHPVLQPIYSDPLGTHLNTPCALFPFLPHRTLQDLLNTPQHTTPTHFAHTLGSTLAQHTTLTFPTPGAFTQNPSIIQPWPSSPSQPNPLLHFAHTCLFNLWPHDLPTTTRDNLWTLLQDHTDTFNTIAQHHHLSHSDLNPSNILLHPTQHTLLTLIDWEWAHSGSTWTDLANLTRTLDGLPRNPHPQPLPTLRSPHHTATHTNLTTKTCRSALLSYTETLRTLPTPRITPPPTLLHLRLIDSLSQLEFITSTPTRPLLKMLAFTRLQHTLQFAHDWDTLHTSDIASSHHM